MQPYEPTKAEVMKTRRNIRNSCLWCFSMLCFEPSRDISANIRRTMTTGERNRAGPVDGLQGASASNLSRLRSIRGKIASREFEIEGLVAAARKRSDRRVQRRGEGLHARNELEEAVLDLDALRHGRSTAAEKLQKNVMFLERELQKKRLDLLANSPPFVLKLEQALAIVARLEEVAGHSLEPGTDSLSTRTRWRSSLVALMKDASGAIERRKDLLGRVEIDTSVRSNSPDLELAAASARRLSIHINAWPPPTLSRELNNTWFVAVTAEANVNPQFKAIVDKWRSVGKQLRQCLSSAREDEKTDARRVEGAMKRVRDCKVRAKIVAKGVKAGRWKRREEGFLRKELKHLESKIAPVSNPAQLAARYNILLTKCAEIGAWQTAVAAYKSVDARSAKCNNGVSDSRRCLANSPFPGPIVYRHLLRAAKNATPPRPKAAFSVLSEMRSRGKAPSASHYNIVLSACVRSAAASGIARVAGTAGAADALRDLLHRYVTMRSLLAQRAKTCRLQGHGDARTGIDENEMGERGSSDSFRDIAIKGSTSPAESTSANTIVVAPFPADGDYILGASLSQTQFADYRNGSGDEPSRSRHEALGQHGCNSVFPHKMYGIEKGLQLEGQEPKTVTKALRLALEVVADMRMNGVQPTGVAYNTLVEACRCSAVGAAKICEIWEGEPGRQGKVAFGSCSPADVYSTLKQAGIPGNFCYGAGIENALHGGRRYPTYISKIYR